MAGSARTCSIVSGSMVVLTPARSSSAVGVVSWPRAATSIRFTGVPLEWCWSPLLLSLRTVSTRDMVEALIAGQRDPQVLADLARGAMRGKRTALIEALTGRFDAHHGELARILLDQIDRLNTEIAKVTQRIGVL